MVASLGGPDLVLHLGAAQAYVPGARSMSPPTSCSSFSPPVPWDTAATLSEQFPFLLSMATHSQDDPGSLLEKALLLNSSQAFCKEEGKQVCSGLCSAGNSRGDSILRPDVLDTHASST